MGCIISLIRPGVPTLVTPAPQRIESRQTTATDDFFFLGSGVPFRNIGPSVQSGRVVDMAVDQVLPIFM
ncbi:MAG: hypothetical protein R2795_03030 [Saprospiraceae bacterium]